MAKGIVCVVRVLDFAVRDDAVVRRRRDAMEVGVVEVVEVVVVVALVSLVVVEVLGVIGMAVGLILLLLLVWMALTGEDVGQWLVLMGVAPAVAVAVLLFVFPPAVDVLSQRVQLVELVDSLGRSMVGLRTRKHIAVLVATAKPMAVFMDVVVFVVVSISVPVMVRVLNTTVVLI